MLYDSPSKTYGGLVINMLKNKTHVNKDNIRKNSKRLYHEYKVGDKVIPNHSYDFKYRTLYKGSFDITQCCTNSTVTLKCGVIKIRYIICHIKPYISDAHLEYIAF